MNIPARYIERTLWVILIVLLVLGWSDAWARDVLITECETVSTPPKPLPEIRIVRFAQSC